MSKIKFILSKLPSAEAAGEEAISAVRGVGERKKEKGQCRREKNQKTKKTETG